MQGDYEAHARTLERLGFRRETEAKPAPPGAYRLVRRAADLQGIEGLILPGGESTTMLKFLEEADFLASLRDFAATHPCFGTCAGAILLARKVTHPEQTSLGLLDMDVERNAYGRQIDSFIGQGEWTEGVLSSGQTAPEMVFIRAPRFRRPGQQVEILACRQDDPVLVRDGKLLAAAFHPELTDDTRVHEIFLRMIRNTRHSPASVGTID